MSQFQIVGLEVLQNAGPVAVRDCDPGPAPLPRAHVQRIVIGQIVPNVLRELLNDLRRQPLLPPVPLRAQEAHQALKPLPGKRVPEDNQPGIGQGGAQLREEAVCIAADVP